MENTLQDARTACVRALPASGGSFEEAPAAFRNAFDTILAVLRRDSRFMFDADGRPGALAAVREALPPAEGELLDAILEDVTAELAANREALYQVLLACRTRP